MADKLNNNSLFSMCVFLVIFSLLQDSFKRVMTRIFQTIRFFLYMAFVFFMPTLSYLLKATLFILAISPY